MQEHVAGVLRNQLPLLQHAYWPVGQLIVQEAVASPLVAVPEHDGLHVPVPFVQPPSSHASATVVPVAANRAAVPSALNLLLTFIHPPLGLIGNGREPQISLAQANQIQRPPFS